MKGEFNLEKQGFGGEQVLKDKDGNGQTDMGGLHRSEAKPNPMITYLKL